MEMERQPYTTDLNDGQWELIRPCIPPLKPGGRPFKYPRREIVNAILYVARSGCAWRLLPHDFPDWQDVYHCFNEWSKTGVWERANDILRGTLRRKQGRNPAPSAGAIDTQSVKTTERGGPHGFDGAKKINGRKRHIVVDTLGLLMALQVHAANVNERASAEAVLAQARQKSQRLALVWADQGYRSGPLKERVSTALGIDLQIVGKMSQAPGIWWPANEPLPESHLKAVAEWEEQKKQKAKGEFKVLPHRWVVERTFGWLGRYRRLSKDYEFRTRNSEAMVYAAMVNNMSRRIVST